MKIIKGILMLVMVILWGCSTANDSTIALDASGKHPTGWAVASNGGQHPAIYLNSPEKCTECHGSSLTGGISKVSCFSADRNGMTCHAQGPLGHPAGWSVPAAHGAHAKAAAIGADGMAFCANCHGADYRGKGLTQKDCQRCHTKAPHPDAINWRSRGAVTHVTTHSSNAAVCAQCHTAQKNLNAAGLAKLPATPIIGSGGCFNNTLCHGVMGHDFPYPGATHMNISFEEMNQCGNCHGGIGTSGPYPVAAGTPPECASCHTGWAVGNIGCGACHGDPSIGDGRPNGIIFPNRQGKHSNGISKHSNLACTECHPFTTGDIRHGWSNRQKSSAAQVGGAKITSWNSGTKSCWPTCHGNENW